MICPSVDDILAEYNCNENNISPFVFTTAVLATIVILSIIYICIGYRCIKKGYDTTTQPRPPGGSSGVELTVTRARGSTGKTVHSRKTSAEEGDSSEEMRQQQHQHHPRSSNSKRRSQRKTSRSTASSLSAYDEIGSVSRSGQNSPRNPHMLLASPRLLESPPELLRSRQPVLNSVYSAVPTATASGGIGGGGGGGGHYDDYLSPLVTRLLPGGAGAGGDASSMSMVDLKELSAPSAVAVSSAPTQAESAQPSEYGLLRLATSESSLGGGEGSAEITNARSKRRKSLAELNVPLPAVYDVVQTVRMPNPTRAEDDALAASTAPADPQGDVAPPSKTTDQYDSVTSAMP